MSVRVNAVTGELLGFHLDQSWHRQSGKEAGQLIREEAQKIAEVFLRKIQSERFKQVKLVNTREPCYVPVRQGDQPSSYSFDYRRVVNGIAHPGNGFKVVVDSATDDIAAYNFNWSDMYFPPAEGVLNKAEATSRYLARQPLVLSYVEVYRSSEKREIRLVYRPVPRPGTQVAAMIVARTGEA